VAAGALGALRSAAASAAGAGAGAGAAGALTSEARRLPARSACASTVSLSLAG
jgi:hypothetical protein